jgi:hypothetical protein
MPRELVFDLFGNPFRRTGRWTDLPPVRVDPFLHWNRCNRTLTKKFIIIIIIIKYDMLRKRFSITLLKSLSCFAGNG